MACREVVEEASILHEVHIVRKAREMDTMAESVAGDRLGIVPDKPGLRGKRCFLELELEVDDAAARQHFRQKQQQAGQADVTRAANNLSGGM